VRTVEAVVATSVVIAEGSRVPDFDESSRLQWTPKQGPAARSREIDRVRLGLRLCSADEHVAEADAVAQAAQLGSKREAVGAVSRLRATHMTSASQPIGFIPRMSPFWRARSVAAACSWM